MTTTTTTTPGVRVTSFVHRARHRRRAVRRRRVSTGGGGTSKSSSSSLNTTTTTPPTTTTTRSRRTDGDETWVSYAATVRASSRALDAYFAEVDAQTLAEDVDDDDDDARRRRRGEESYAAARALEPLFAAPDAAVMKDIAALTPRRSDPMATIRRLGKRTTCGDASATTLDADAGRPGHRRRVADAAHRARWRNDGVALLFEDIMEIDAPMPVVRDDAVDATEDAVVDAAEIRADVVDDDDDGVYGMLFRAARDDRERIELPSDYTIDEVRPSSTLSSLSSFAEHSGARDLALLSEAFSLEDGRVGAVANAAALGRGVAHILRDERGAAIGYTLTYENPAPAWERTRAVTLPPRLAHVYIRPEMRSRGLGTALTKWWMSRFALTCAFFAVDAPNASMHRTLSRLECALATTRSGHEASSVHFVSTTRCEST